MISCDLYISGPEDSLNRVAKALNISPDLMIAEFETSDYDFYTERRNAMFIFKVRGAFQYKIDLEVFDIEGEAAFFERLISLSKQGIKTALPDEKSESPFVMCLFESGHMRKVFLDEHEATQTLSQVEITDSNRN